MTDKNISEVTTYLNLETIAFIINNFINFFMVILIFINKAKYFYLSCLLKTVFIIIGDLYLIPKFQVNGVAFSNILVNLLILIFCLFVLYKEDLFPKFSLNFDKALSELLPLVEVGASWEVCAFVSHIYLPSSSGSPYPDIFF